MRFSKWFRLFARVSQRVAGYRLGMEPLEDRCLLASFTQFPTPTSQSAVQDIVAGPDQNLWFTETPRNKIGRCTPDGIITEFVVPTTDSHPSRITAGPDGNLWFTETVGNKIGRITPAGAFAEFAIPTANGSPRGITVGPDGNLWFAENGGHKIGRITPGGTITEFALPAGNTSPNGIAVGPDGNLWFTLGGGSRIGRVTPSGAITMFGGAASGIGAGGITAGPDGNLWFTEQIVNKIGRITTAGVLTEFVIPTADSNPLDITLGPDGNLWFVEFTGEKIARITPAGAITESPTLGGGLRAIAAGPDGNLWVCMANSIGRQLLLDPSATSLNLRVGQAFSGTVASVDVFTRFARPADFTVTISWGDGTSSGGVLSGIGSTFAVTGSHTYQQAGDFTVAVTITLFDFPIVDATATFSATVNPATHLAFLQQPVSTKAGKVMVPAIKVAVMDVANNIVSNHTSTITLSLGNNPVGAALGGTLTATAVNGIATFSNLVINQPGYGFTLFAGTGLLTGVHSLPFNIYGDVTAPFGVSGDTPLIGDWNGDGRDKIGVYRPSSQTFLRDLNGDGKFTDTTVDAQTTFGAAGAVPLVGDWNGDGRDDIGVFEPSTAIFRLDLNGNGIFDGDTTDVSRSFGAAIDTPLVGDWNGDDKSDIGVYRPSTTKFFLDVNGNYRFDAATDVQAVFGAVGDLPLLGDWTGLGKTSIGAWRSSNATFFLDLDGNNLFSAGVDAAFAFGLSSDKPLVGDWTGDGRSKIGVWRSSGATFLLDLNGNGAFDGPTVDAQNSFGAATDVPLLGDWNGDRKTKIGVRRDSNATFFLDLNGNRRYEAPTGTPPPPPPPPTTPPPLVATAPSSAAMTFDLPLDFDFTGTGQRRAKRLA